ncbi:hypothetical protein BDW62DRAFT_201629 [Aspergillus aurantiobrunneus]
MEANFFSRFPTFQPDPSAPITAEFACLAHHMNWWPSSTVYRTEWANFLAAEFIRCFGAGTKLQQYQALYQALGLEEPVPTSITQCRKALGRVHVNLIDLIDANRLGKEVRKFQSVAALAKYTRKKQKAFPKAAAKKEGVLRDLLREIWGKTY